MWAESLWAESASAPERWACESSLRWYTMEARTASRPTLPCRLRRWRSQLALVVNAYWQSRHSYGRSPLCVRMCRMSAPLSWLVLGHMLHRYGA